MAALVGFLDLFDDGGELVAAGLENGIVAIDADARLVGRDDLHGEAVDVLKLGGLGLGGAGHAREFFIHAEVVLDRDRRVGAGLALDHDVLLGLDGLVQPVGPTAARHDAAGVLVNDHDLALLDDVFDVFLVERIGAQELGNGVDLLGNLGVTGLGGELLGFALLRVDRFFFEIGELGGEVGEDKRVGVVGAELFATDLGQVGLMLALVDDVEQVFFDAVKFGLVEIGVEVGLNFVEELAVVGRLEEAEELLVVGSAHFHLKHLARGLVAVFGGRRGLFEQRHRLGNEPVAEAGLVVDQFFDGRLDARKGLLALDRRGAGNDQRRAGLIDEDGVDFVHDTEPVVALDLVFFARGHAVVAEVIEAKLAGGAVGDVAAIHLAADIGRHLLLDTADGDPEETVEVPHPLGVAAGEVVVDRDELGVATAERVQVKRQRGDEGLAFAGRHLGDFALMDRHAADQLDVEVHHVPGELVFADDDFSTLHAASRVLDGGESLGEQRREGGFLVGGGGDARAELVGLGAELLVGESLVGQLDFVDARDDRAALFEEFTVVAARKLFEEKREHEKAENLGAARTLANGKSTHAGPRRSGQGRGVCPSNLAQSLTNACTTGEPTRWAASRAGIMP